MPRESKRIPTILTSQEILDKAFKRAAAIKKSGVDRVDTTKKNALAKISMSGDVVSGTLGRYVKAFPSLEKGEEFYAELIDVLIGTDELKKSLAALDWCGRKTAEFARDYLARIRRSAYVSEVHRLRKEFYGRLSSLVDQIDEDLRKVALAREKLKEIPFVDLETPAVVVAGHPNVGKSALVERLSSARPAIAPYPFTTKGIGVGHLQIGWRTYQIIDTPGLLDRPLEERNWIERQAILALKYLADMIVFLLDPTETSGYSMSDQLSLLASVESVFDGIPIIVVENKVDVLRTDSDRMKISALTGEGVAVLINRIVEVMKAAEKAAG